MVLFTWVRRIHFLFFWSIKILLVSNIVRGNKHIIIEPHTRNNKSSNNKGNLSLVLVLLHPFRPRFSWGYKSELCYLSEVESIYWKVMKLRHQSLHSPLWLWPIRCFAELNSPVYEVTQDLHWCGEGAAGEVKVIEGGEQDLGKAIWLWT